MSRTESRRHTVRLIAKASNDKIHSRLNARVSASAVIGALTIATMVRRRILNPSRAPQDGQSHLAKDQPRNQRRTNPTPAPQVGQCRYVTGRLNPLPPIEAYSQCMRVHGRRTGSVSSTWLNNAAQAIHKPSTAPAPPAPPQPHPPAPHPPAPPYPGSPQAPRRRWPPPPPTTRASRARTRTPPSPAG
jgi:hypothetical protein